MFKKFPLLSRFLVWVVMPITLLTGSLWLYLNQNLRAQEGERRLVYEGKSAQVVVDAGGVAYISADTDLAAFYALGFVHARDRMWQMEVQRRVVRGELSEVFGRKAAGQDAWMRTLGLIDAARSSWNALSTPAQASLTAYAAGVNAWLTSKPILQPEFYLFDVRPAPWTELDSLAWAKMFALDLAANMRHEIMNALAGEFLDEAQLPELLSLSAEQVRRTGAGFGDSFQTLQRLADLQSELDSTWPAGGRYVGSNAWVVSGAHTQSGRALLANDPHLGLQIPSPWYVTRMRGSSLDTTGMTLVGLPLVIFGKNATLAWGATNLMADVQDLRLEQVNPQAADEYRTENGWRKFEIREEQVRVRAEFPAMLRAEPEPITVRIRRTRNGPIVSDVLGSLSATEQPVSLRWTALDEGDTSYEAFFRLNYAASLADLTAALSLLVAPSLNFVYADVHGNIGSIAAGRIPLRRAGDGREPLPGWMAEYQWNGYLPFDEMPQVRNPEHGYVISANHDITPPDYSHFISRDWAAPHRARRIEDLLSRGMQTHRLTAADMARIQGDVVDISVSHLVEFLRQRKYDRPRHQEAVHRLDAWHGDMSADSEAATIFFVWARYLREELFVVKMKDYWNKPEQAHTVQSLVDDTSYDDILRALTTSSAVWCDGQHEANRSAPCDRQIEIALDRTLEELTRLRGSDMDSWQWGQVHFRDYAHRPMSKLRAVAPLFERRISSGGSPDTVNVANAEFRRSEGYAQTHGASFRQIIEPGGEGAEYRYENSTGQSGHVLSEHYDDFIHLFSRLDYRALDQGIESKRQGRR